MKIKLTLMILLAFGVMHGSSLAHAAFSLGISPDRGGRDVRFTSSKPGREVLNEEVTFTVTTDQAKQFRIIQEQLTPFTNERGQWLPEGAVQVFSPTSVNGTINLVFPHDLSPGQKTIYTSNAAGDGESFQLVYAVDPAKTQEAAGRYHAQLVYRMEAVEGLASSLADRGVSASFT